MSISSILTGALLCLAVVHGYVVEERAFCPESYSPCQCTQTTNGLEVSCIDVPTDQISNVFYRTKTRDLFSVSISATPSVALDAVDIPIDLLSDKRAASLLIHCPTKTTVDKFGLNIDAKAFQYTRDYTTRFEIDNCDLAGSPGLKFLLDFLVLKQLTVTNSISVDLTGLPALNSLNELTLTDSTGIEEHAATFPLLTPARLAKFSANRCQLTDAGAKSILSRIGQSTSAGSLVHLDLSDNQLAKIPTEILSMSRLSNLNLTKNVIVSTGVGDLSLIASVTAITLDSNGMTGMASGTFNYGDYARAVVSIRNNQLPEFSKGVFLSVLQQMKTGAGGYIDAKDNPFSCRCSLAWLIRDNPDLIPYVKNGVCEGFFKFEDLNPNSYAECGPQ